MSTAVGDPGSLAMLERRISNYARDTNQTPGRVRVTMSQVVVSQLLPDSLIKGGSGMKLRFGSAFTRDSKDLDTAVRGDHAAFLEQFAEALAQGWGPFVGTVMGQPQRPRLGVPSGYLMHPYVVKLNVYKRPFASVTLEIGYDELDAIGDDSAELVLANDILEMFAVCGMPAPSPVPVLAIHHQIAQKVHACTELGSERAHDLVDLQLLWRSDEASIVLIEQTTRRLFNFRRTHVFPGRCTVGLGWDTAYAAASVGLPVRATVDEAAHWLNERLAELASRAAD